MTPEYEKKLVTLIGERFIARKSAKARQFTDGSGWAPVREPAPPGEVGADIPFKMSDFREHFAGRQSFGHYLTDPVTGMCKLFAYDIDLRKVQPDAEKPDYWVPNMNAEGKYYDPRSLWANGPGADDVARRELERLRGHMHCLAIGLCYSIHRFTQGKVHVAMAYSGGKGLHVYGFTGLAPVANVHNLAIKILESTKAFEPVRGNVFWRHRSEFQSFDVEVFPKQQAMDGKDYGNLMALPLGVHAATGQRRFFVDSPGENIYAGFNEREPTEILEGRLPWGDEYASMVSSEMWRGMVGSMGEEL